MSLGWLIATALLIAIYCLLFYIRKVITCKKTEYDESSPGITLLFLVKNQQDIIEGLVRTAFTDACIQSVDVIAVDLGSVDQTRLILERLSGSLHHFRFLALCEESGVSKKIYRLCRGQVIYCFDLTGHINYSLMARAIHSILNGSRACLYRTKVLYKSDKLVPHDKG